MVNARNALGEARVEQGKELNQSEGGLVSAYPGRSVN